MKLIVQNYESFQLIVFDFSLLSYQITQRLDHFRITFLHEQLDDISFNSLSDEPGIADRFNGYMSY
mgnify:CR=1 FL=1